MKLLFSRVLHLNKKASLMVINDDVFTGTVSASSSAPLSTQIRFMLVIISKFKTLIL